MLSCGFKIAPDLVSKKPTIFSFNNEATVLVFHCQLYKIR